MTNKHLLATAGAIAMATSPAVAQDDGWSFEGTLYLFAADTTLNVGGRESELSFSDALDNLEFGGMGAFAARYGKWTFLADLMYFDLLFENATPGPAFSRLDTDADMTVLNAVALYEVQQTPTWSLSLGGGFRYFETNTTLTLQPGTQPRRQFRVDDSWTDPVVAAIGQLELSEKWRSTLAADYGGFSSNRETYQVTLTFDYAFSENWSARFGYRYLNVDNRDANFRAQLSGPVLGVSYRF